MAVDDKQFTMAAGEVITITSGQIHCLKKATRAKGDVLAFTLDFYCKNDNDIALIFLQRAFLPFRNQ